MAHLSPFIGRHVKCINIDTHYSGAFASFLEINKIYTIRAEQGADWVLEGERSSWLKTRFNLLKRVKCIEASDTGNSLWVNKVYEVTGEGAGAYYLFDTWPEGPWGASRFELYDASADDQTVMPLGRLTEKIDTDEQNKLAMLAFFKGPIEPGHCSCKILRELCAYHNK